ncbi:hypothetical protein FCM35_KLT15618 [Carex littledalei]|uniref:Uncharacterized protein n=1 Tax=Carex littledalei TaxID=544730 RepID=A0A833RHZ1_9POAL|nr:hypothetical protein FCM35_KLT15618 [Carex littledalei]
MEAKPKTMKVLQLLPNPSLKKKRISKTSERQSSLYVARKISSQISQNEEEANRRTQEAETAAQRAIRLRAHAQALMEQADLATYRAVMAGRIFYAKFNMSASQATPNSKPDPDVMPFASID